MPVSSSWDGPLRDAARQDYTLDDVLNQDAADQVLILVIALVTLSVVLLSAAGI